METKEDSNLSEGLDKQEDNNEVEENKWDLIKVLYNKFVLGLFLIGLLSFLFTSSLILLSFLHVDATDEDDNKEYDVVSVYNNYIFDLNNKDIDNVIDYYFSSSIKHSMESFKENMEKMRNSGLEFKSNVLSFYVDEDGFHFVEVEEWFSGYAEVKSRGLYMFSEEDGQLKIQTVRGLEEE